MILNFTTPPAPTTRAAPGLRRALLALHRWGGLGAGLVLALLGLSGSLLVVGDALDATLAPALRRVVPVERAAPLADVVAAVQAAQGGALPAVLHLPEAKDAALEAWMDAGGVVRVFVDPRDARVLGVRRDTDGLVGFVRALHLRLAAGELGHTVVGALGLVLLGLVLGGAWLWWPGWRKLRVGLSLRRPLRGVRARYDTHKLLGVLGTLLLVLAAVTGASLVFHEAARVLVRAPAQPPPERLAPRAAPLRPAELGPLLAAADAALPGARTVRVHLPTAPDAPLRVRKRFASEPHPNGMSFVVLDPASGRVLSVTDARRAPPSERLLHLRYPLHTGVALGAPGRALAALTGLLPSALLLTGFLLWRARRRAARPS